MTEESKITRRNFLRNSALAGSSLMLSGNIFGSVSWMFQSEEHKEHLAAVNDMLKGVSDIHVHAATDSNHFLFLPLFCEKTHKDIWWIL